MSRFVQVATAAGVTSDVLGTGTTTFCGNGEYLYDVPGAYTPIWVCCCWTTPIAGNVEIDVNFSLYDEVKFAVSGMSGYCCNCQGLMVIPSNSNIDTCLSGTCYCCCNLWNVQTYSENTCNTTNQQGCLCTGAFTCWNRAGFAEFIFKGYQQTFACECQCKTPLITAEIRAQSVTKYIQRQVSFNASCRCFYPGYWPKGIYEDMDSLPATSFCKLVIRAECNCFTPLLCQNAQCDLDGAFFGVWGIPKSNPNVTAKSSVYQTE